MFGTTRDIPPLPPFILQPKDNQRLARYHSGLPLANMILYNQLILNVVNIITELAGLHLENENKHTNNAP